MTPFSDNQTVLAAVSVAVGAAATGTSRYFLGSRKIDKIDAVKAVADAYDRHAAALHRHIEDLSALCRQLTARCDTLERELRKRDEILLAHIGKTTQGAT